MKKARNCNECEYYTQKYCCDRVDDPAFVFPVSPDRTTCLYENPGRRLSEAEITTRDKKAEEGRKKFEKHLEDVTRIISTWPKWKQKILGGIGYVIKD